MRRKLKKKIGWRLWLIRKLLPIGWRVWLVKKLVKILLLDHHVHHNPDRKNEGTVNESTPM
jgi:hemolysin-activating ACP:hemolysin acyltransferase